MSVTYWTSWWNLENLFDSVNSPRRTEKLKRAIGSDLKGWTTTLRDKKIDQLAKVVAFINGGQGPDLLGICEVENKFVVDRLKERLLQMIPNRSYEVVHADTDDQRGIDIAFIYETSKLKAPDDQVFQHIVMRRTATRSILQVNFQTKPAERTWTIFGNHWPARSAGVEESSGYRQIAGETLAYFHQRAREVHGDETPVLAMGDFNDEPFNLSLSRHALSTRQRTKVVRGTSPRLWNLMWPHMGAGKGTFYYSNFANMLDQFLVNENMVKQDSPIKADPNSVLIEDSFPGINNPDATYPKPIRFGGMGQDVNEEGFSDHYPISILVTED